MAASFCAKKKSSWKNVVIPNELFNEQQFGALIEIKELTDYELLSWEADSSNENLSGTRLSSKRKRKNVHVDKTASNPVEHATPQSIDKKKQMKKQENHGGHAACKVKPIVTDETATQITDHDMETLTAPQKRKKNKSGSAKRRKTSNDADKLIASTDNKTAMENTSAQTDGQPGSHTLNEMCALVNPIGSDKLEKLGKKRKKRKQRKDKTLEGHSKVKDDHYLMSKTCISRTNMDAGALSSDTKKEVQDALMETCGEVEHWEDSSSEDGETASTRKNQLELDMSQWKNLLVPDVLLQALQHDGLDTPTPIQNLTLPSAIRDRRDILAAAETGSGKTLAFGIPVFARILNKLENCEKEESDEKIQFPESDLKTNSLKLKSIKDHLPPLALILEPTRELAVQVKNHLTALAKYTNIKIATIVGGMSIEKQRRILGKKPHVVIATPGRLWQLIEEGNEHLVQLDKVLCLVVDEADRMIEKGHYEELTKVIEMMNSSQREKKRQTFVMSATLTMDVGAPRRLGNKIKKKAISEDKLKTLTDRICVGSKPKVIDLTPKDKVSHTLTELRMNCKAEEKDFYLYYFLCHHSGRTLVFANSKDCVRRLISLLTLLQCSPLPLHADMQQRQRLKNLERFADNNKGLLVASDVAARGLDIPNVDYVVHYQVPRTMENYIHRSGRTARALKLGLSVMLVGPEEARDYRKIVHGVRNGEELALLPVEADLLPAVKQRVSLARSIDVKEYRIKKKRLRNNFFTKAAQDMDMIIDDENLLEDMGDLVEQAQDSQQLKHMKAQLVSLLRGSLMPLHMTKYPTKSGQLLSHQNPVDLHSLR